MSFTSLMEVWQNRPKYENHHVDDGSGLAIIWLIMHAYIGGCGPWRYDDGGARGGVPGRDEGQRNEERRYVRKERRESVKCRLHEANLVRISEATK